MKTGDLSFGTRKETALETKDGPSNGVWTQYHAVQPHSGVEPALRRESICIHIPQNAARRACPSIEILHAPEL